MAPLVVDDALKAKLKKQVEFYFSDSNLPRDAFLLGKTKESPDGFVSIALLCTFSRMAQALGLASREASLVPPEAVEAVASAVEGSSSVSLNAARDAVGRSSPLEEAPDSAASDARTLFASPFPYDATLDAIEGAFASLSSEVRAVRLRRHAASKDFRGSVFVEFASPEEAQRVLEAAKASPPEFAGAPLALETKADFVARRAAEKEAAAKRAEKRKQERGDADADADADAAPSAAKRARAADGSAVDAAGAPSAPEFTPGCALRFVFASPSSFHEPPTFALVKDSFGGRDGGIRYVEYETGAAQGTVRFESPQAAAKALAGATPLPKDEGNDEAPPAKDGEQAAPKEREEAAPKEGEEAAPKEREEAAQAPKEGEEAPSAAPPAAALSLQIAGYAATVRLLEGEEEIEFYMADAAARKAAEAAKAAKGGRGGRGRGGRGRGGRGRGGRGGTRGRGRR